ncbi:MAG: phosphatidylglycerol lysyltransferase domain-containing protein [Alcaligenaceae bacterium]
MESKVCGIAALIDGGMFSVTEDRNSFDYIYSTEKHRSFSGGDFSGKRNEVSSILKSHPAIKVVDIDVYDLTIQKKITDLYQKWANNKLANVKNFEAREEAAFKRLLDIANQDLGNLQGIGVYHNDDLLAFLIYEIVNSEYAVGHTAKCDVSIKGTNAILMKNLADKLYSAGIKYFNYEQDLGLENLRISKERYRPSFFLKKYLVTLI